MKKCLASSVAKSLDLNVGKQDYEWLHLVAFRLAPNEKKRHTNTPNNLVLGTA